MRTQKEWLIRVILLMIGLTIAHFGVTLCLLAELGSDPFNVLVQGLYRTVSMLPYVTHGRVHIVVSLIIIAILLFADRKKIKIGTVLCMICGGPIIDLFSTMLSPLNIPAMQVHVRLIILAAGCAILAFGMTIVIKSDAGTGPNDLVAIVISEKLSRPFSIVRIIVDLCFVLTGWLLGGTFGIGTIVCAALVGPIAGLFLPLNERTIARILHLAGID